MQRVPVVSKDGKPLMPTKPSKARKLVRDGLAIGKWNKLNQYYLKIHQVAVIAGGGKLV